MNSEFITVDEAIKLIESDSRENPVVDIKQMTDSYTYIELAHNFRIPLLAVNKDGFIVENGNRYITFEKEIDVLRFREVVLNHYKETTSAEYDEEAITNPTKSITTVSDPETNPASIPKTNPDGAKAGDDTNGKK